MTRRQKAHGTEAARRRPLARGIVRRALTDPAIFDAIISEADAAEIDRGLAEVAREIAEGHFAFSRALEDIHMNVEARL